MPGDELITQPIEVAHSDIPLSIFQQHSQNVAHILTGEDGGTNSDIFDDAEVINERKMVRGLVKSVFDSCEEDPNRLIQYEDFHAEFQGQIDTAKSSFKTTTEGSDEKIRQDLLEREKKELEREIQQKERDRNQARIQQEQQVTKDTKKLETETAYSPEQSAKAAETNQRIDLFEKWMRPVFDDMTITKYDVQAQASKKVIQAQFATALDRAREGSYTDEITTLTGTSLRKLIDRIRQSQYNKPVDYKIVDDTALGTFLSQWDKRQVEFEASITEKQRDQIRQAMETARIKAVEEANLFKTLMAESAERASGDIAALNDLADKMTEQLQELNKDKITTESVQQEFDKRFYDAIPKEVQRWIKEPHLINPWMMIFPNLKKRPLVYTYRGFGGHVDTGEDTGDLYLHFIDSPDHRFTQPHSWIEPWKEEPSNKGDNTVFNIVEETPEGQERYSITTGVNQKVDGEKQMGILITCLSDGNENSTETFIPYGKPKPLISILRKPIIYLYPTKPTDVSMSLQLEGKITHHYPQMLNNVWNVTATPQGSIQYMGKTYRYLFWEGDYGKNAWNLDKGFCVQSSKLELFFEEQLSKLGVNSEEIQDFITYWVPLLDEKNSPWMQISFQQKEYESIAQLIVKPLPDTLIRIFAVFKPLNNPIDIEKQIFQPIKRQGFVVVEWGGTVI